MKNSIAIFCGSHKGANPHFETEIERLGSMMASQHRTLIYGGSNKGYMGTVSNPFVASGGNLVAIIPHLFPHEVIHSQPASHLMVVESMQERKQQMLDLADAFIALPGGVGTLDELTEVLSAIQLQLVDKPVALLNIDGFFDSFLQQLQMMVREGFMQQTLLNRILVASSAEEVLDKVDKD
ncbi:MAG: TIGR00730 family Rossman fold protein [Bacteroidales bacterium]|nr:TIGR00730 family Rossman fold protein [Bacteroidales bacterium]